MTNAPQPAQLGGPRPGCPDQASSSETWPAGYSESAARGRLGAVNQVIGTASRCAKNGFVVRDTANGKGEKGCRGFASLLAF
jgi:hypothetical protein